MTKALAPALFIALLAPQSSSLRNNERVGYVDLHRLLGETKEGHQLRARIDGLREKRQAELDQAAKDLSALGEQLEKQRLILKADALASREHEYRQKASSLESTYLRLQQDLAQEEAKAIKTMVGKSQPLIERIADQEGLSLVLERNEAGILWAKASLDLTNELIRRYDAAPVMR
jgi:outer membrane protein